MPLFTDWLNEQLVTDFLADSLIACLFDWLID